MKILIVGNGAREHAIVAALSKDAEVFSIMSKKNPAIASLSKEHWICDIENQNDIAKIINDQNFDLGFASPDATLAAGITDVLSKKMLVASPTKAASRIEWDKSFMRSLSKKYNIKGAPIHKTINDVFEIDSFIEELKEVAVKPIGLTAGKGVKVSGDQLKNGYEAKDYAKFLIKKDGIVLIEEKLVGEEFTLQAFSDGSRIALMPPVQDHKRAFIHDLGPNTGGMGSYSTGSLLPFLKQSDIDNAAKIIQDFVYALKKEGTPFVGILYGQFIATSDGIKLIEFNARFGDPEAMNVLTLLESSLSNIFLSMADSQLDHPDFSSDSTVVKYLVPNGYPESPIKDAPVSIDFNSLEKSGAFVFYASVYEKNGSVFTTSSRSFGLVGRAKTVFEAEKIAEDSCKHFVGPLWHREDIGTKELIQKKIDHMVHIRG